MTDKELNQIKETTQNGTYIDINTHFRDIKKLQSEINRQQAEIERLEKEVDRLSQVVMYNDSVADLKASDAIKEFAEFNKLAKDIPLDRLQEICQAERDGRLVVLPHPIGCKVYRIETDGVLKGMIREVTVAGYSENKWQGRANSEKDHRFVIFHNSYNQPIACQLCNVYRTREEAEQALKGGMDK